jgi:hypothetical protein
MSCKKLWSEIWYSNILGTKISNTIFFSQKGA